MQVDEIRALKSSWRAYLRQRQKGDPDLAIGMAGTFTIDPLIPFLGANLLASGYGAPRIVNADYNQVVQTCLNPSKVFGGQTDIILILWRLEDIASIRSPELLYEASQMLLGAVEKLSASFSGSIIMAIPPRPQAALKVCGIGQLEGYVRVWHEVCLQTMESFSRIENVYLIDLGSIFDETDAPLDERKRLLYRQPYSESFFSNCAAMVSRIARARSFEAKKCLVVDCDNTLWGGIIGEDGVHGVSLGNDFPGRVYKEVQSQIKELKNTGVFIALNTKNNPDDVWEMFDKHDAMVLSRDDISSAQINWAPKSENIKRIASELNIGVDSLVFLDDNPFEIDEVKKHVSEVTVLQVPEVIEDYPMLIKSNEFLFDRIHITEDDIQRVDRMKGERARQENLQSMTQEDFLSNLDLKVYVYPPEKQDLVRVTQLINKTNQFNCTTRRYTSEQVMDFTESDEYKIFCMSVADKFGEYGLVGIAILHKTDAKSWTFDTFLMSCRVLGRGVETAFLSAISKSLEKQGAERIFGEYIPTPKNTLVENLYERHGFACEEAMSEGTSFYWSTTLPLSVACPEYVMLTQDRFLKR